MSGINLKNIHKSFGKTPVLKGINLDINDGEFLTLVGPSGCGKSTLLRIIAGLEHQDIGDVTIGMSLVNQVRASRRDLAMVFQSYALYPHLTVEQNMETPLRLRDMTTFQRFPLIGCLFPGYYEAKKKINQTVDQTSEILKITALLDRKPGQLSGGQRQRAALGRAMVRHPSAFLMDEPLSNLDAALRVHMRAELADLHRSLKTTFIYVTHDQAEALTLSDRMAVMIDGELLQVGPPEELYKNPLDKRVAEFVGSPKINMLPAEINNEGRITSLGATIRGQSTTYIGSGFVGIRPENLKLVSSRQSPECWAFEVTHKENLGADVFLHGRLGRRGFHGIVRETPENAAKLGRGIRTFVRAVPGEALLFDANGNRLPFKQSLDMEHFMVMAEA